MVRVAVFSDIHSNLYALEEVSFKRIPYDIDETAKAIKRVGLPTEFAEDLYTASFSPEF